MAVQVGNEITVSNIKKVSQKVYEQAASAGKVIIRSDFQWQSYYDDADGFCSDMSDTV
ncbi:hypothetical protein L1D59_07515 [Pseudoalteromonas piscicida]|uniref:hypothetical protein n=1 Tax=Pseudoalteromonas piscicida TaxID=43662 RepID=UPI001EFCCD93|nr:hypothetical protein [Pseudoalteromonas piscicida]MCG9768455.1 hypothetical protein [Pseudoalteromonas piscicida]